MQDAVAEVLLERRALVPRRSPFVVLSVIVHVAIAIAALAAGRRSTMQKMTPVLNIRLAPVSTPVAPPPAVTPAPPAPVPTPTPVEEKKPEPPKVAKKEPLKKPVQQTLFGKSTEKPTPKVPSPPNDPGPGTRDPGPTRQVAGGSAGVTGLEGGDFPYTIYINQMLTLIGQRWLRPQTRGDITAQVYFVIERDGRVRDVQLEKESGSGAFDRAAVRAVREASPLPPLPFAYSGNYLGVHLTFH